MTYDEIMKYKSSPNFREVKVKGVRVVTPALKTPVSSLMRCARCGKIHTYFYRLPDGVPFLGDDDSAYPNYTSRRPCQVTALKKED